LHHIQPDHLGSPRKVIQTSNNTAIWNWPILGNAFGEAAPTGSITLNLRFPGQYFDVETGMNYNYFRDYEPGTGRYVESDPIGFEGGFNTYAYVGNAPLRRVDPRGLVPGAGPGSSPPGWQPLKPPIFSCEAVCNAVAVVVCYGAAEITTPIGVAACAVVSILVCNNGCAEDPVCPPASPPSPPPLPPAPPTASPRPSPPPYPPTFI